MLSNEQAALLIKYYQTISLSDEQQERLCSKYWDASPVERAEIARVYAHLFAKDALFIQRLLQHHDERRQRAYEAEQEQHKRERQQKQNRLRAPHSPEKVEKAKMSATRTTTTTTTTTIEAKNKSKAVKVISIDDSCNSNIEQEEEENEKYSNEEEQNTIIGNSFTSNHPDPRKFNSNNNIIHKTNIEQITDDDDTNNNRSNLKRFKSESKMHNIDDDEPTSPLGNEKLSHKYVNTSTSNNVNIHDFSNNDKYNDEHNESDSVASPTLSTSTVNSFDKEFVQSPMSPRTNSTSSYESNEESSLIQTNRAKCTPQAANKHQRELRQSSKAFHSFPATSPTTASSPHLHLSPTLRLSHSQLLTRTAIQDQFPKLIGDGPFCIAFRLVQNEEERRAVIDLYASQFSHPDPPELQRLVMLPQSVSTRTRRRVTGSCTWFIECITTHEIVCAVTVTAHHHKVHHFVEMPLFATAAGYKRNGFGRLLNAALASWCASAGFEFTMVSADAQAIAFWEHLGYVRMSRREKQQIAFYYEHECYKFKKAEPMIGYCTWRELGALGKSGLEPLCTQRVETVLQKMHRFVMIGPLELPNP